MVIKKNGNLCGCGRKGCIEAYASGNAFEKNIKKLNKKGISTKRMFTNYKDAKWSNNIIKDATSVIAEGITNVYVLTGI